MYKKFLLLTLIVLFFTTLSSAQRRFKAGPIVGVTAAQIDGDRYAGYNKLGLSSGIRVEAVLTERAALSVEILYSQRGSQSELVRGTDLFPFQIKTNYIAVPIQYNYKDWLVEEDGEDPYHKVSIAGGITYSRLINATIEDGTPSSPFTNLADFFAQDDISLNIGAAFFAGPHVGFSFRWTRSIVLLYERGDSNLNANSMRSKFLTFNVMYLL
ncbi:MAG: outer membrane beta-barrel protein [Bacteroidota bacterium]